MVTERYTGALTAGAIGLLPLLAVIVSGACTSGSEDESDWRSQWAVEDGFALDVDSEGFEYPSAIAFVPNAGSQPDDPLYFVTELRGRVKVVTNDRQVHTFAEDFILSRPRRELPDIEGETGLAGLCLDPQRGYVFVTFAHADSAGVLRNGIIRFETTPGTFALRPVRQTKLSGIFDDYEVVPSHQVGGCHVAGDFLYVGVGDARKMGSSQDTTSALGKILRMTVEGRPALGNPFYQSDDPTSAVNLVWSYGHRNPFGIHVVQDRVIVADNGSGVDRILEARPGVNYLYDGSDQAMGTNAVSVLVPSVGPAQMEYVDSTSSLPPQFRERLFIATSSVRAAGLITIGYDPRSGIAVAAPAPFVRYLGPPGQVVVAVAEGPDGIYFLPLMPGATGRSVALRATYAPDRAHPVRISAAQSAADLMISKGCLGCHSIEGEGGVVAPPLDREDLVRRVADRVHSQEYARRVAEVDRSEEEPFRSFGEARADVLRQRGDQRVAAWIRYRLIEPRFDDPHAQMPNVGLTDSEARLLTRHLVQRPGTAQRLKAAVKARLPHRPGHRHLLAFGAAGVVVGAGASLGAWVLLGLLRSRRKPRNA